MLADRVRMSRLLDVDVGANPEDIADENCKVATDADFSGTTNRDFRYIGTATSLVIPHVIKGVQVTSYYSMFREGTVTEVRSNNPNVTDISFMFYNSKATTLDLSSFDTSNVTLMNSMFYNSPATTFDLSSFDTSKVTTMASMFNRCYSLTSLDLSTFNTSKVTNMSSMFRDCISLTSLDLSSFDTSEVTSINYIFRGCGSITGYARTQEDADRFNNSSYRPVDVIFTVKGV